jgi:anaerobic selenocysteine-containing dehydrogenase
VRHTEAAAKSDEVLLIRPGSDAALALATMHVICAGGHHDAGFVARHTVGFEALAAHVRVFTPDWAAQRTGLAAERIVDFALRYARTRPAMIVLGGSSMHKGDNGWQAARAIACLPGLTGNVGIPGGGFGPRHGSAAHGRGLVDVSAPQRRRFGPALPNQMASVADALRAGRIDNLLLPGSNMLSSFVDAHALASGLQRTRLVVSHDLFLNETARRFADVVLPATAWLEELGCKMTSTHLYLMEPALAPEGEARSVSRLVRDLAARLGVPDFFPWRDDEALLDVVLDHPSTGPATVASLRRQGGIGALTISPVAHASLDFDTPTRRIEFFSQRAQDLGLPPLPVPDAPVADPFPLALAQGRTLLHFHSFYDNGQALPSLARRDREAQVWLSPADAAARGVVDGAAIRLYNQRGSMSARAHVTPKMAEGAVWLRDGWHELNRLTDGSAVLPDHAVDVFAFAAGQARYGARVEVEAVIGAVTP